MFPDKKTLSRGPIRDEDTEIDFPWMMLMAMSKFGFSLREYGLMSFGMWIDLFETYKKTANFETKRGLYKVMEEPKTDSLDDI